MSFDDLTGEQIIKLINFAYGPTEEEEEIPDSVEIRTGICGHQFRVVKTKRQDKCFFCSLIFKEPDAKQELVK
jgi:hypothetical protein